MSRACNHDNTQWTATGDGRVRGQCHDCGAWGSIAPAVAVASLLQQFGVRVLTLVPAGPGITVPPRPDTKPEGTE